MSLEQIISSYGYLAVAAGTFLEGETILLLAGFAAHRGYLELPWVIFCGFLGTLFGDQLYYYIGRFRGITALAKRPCLKNKSERVFELLDKHQLWLILGFRFMYGLRAVTPFIIGVSGISPLRFLLLNIAGAFICSLTIGLLGYLFGQSIQILLGDIKRYELWFFTILWE